MTINPNRCTATEQAIAAAYVAKNAKEPKRGYLGGSSIGQPCTRRLWYQFRDCAAEDFDGRMLRLFATGHLEEPRVIADLQAIGCEVMADDGNGNQIAVESHAGHMRGHLDGAVRGLPEAPKTWHLLEVKTHSAKSFDDVSKKGVKESKPVHYAQMQWYCGKAELTRWLYVAKNKDTEELYIERGEFDPAEFDRLEAKGARIIEATEAPERIANRADHFECRYCPASRLCHGTGPSAVPVPRLSCRQCVHASPAEDGKWRCDAGQPYGTPCDRHMFLPSLVGFAAPIDGDADWIQYQDADGKTFINGSKPGQHTSQLLTEIPAAIVATDTGQKPADYDPAELARVLRPVWTGKSIDMGSAWLRIFEEEVPWFVAEKDNAIEYPGQRLIIRCGDNDTIYAP